MACIVLRNLQGLCKSIGISNFGVGHLEQLYKYATIPPAVNQIELTPFLQRQELVDYCRSKDIVLEVCKAIRVIDIVLLPYQQPAQSFWCMDERVIHVSAP